MPDFDDETPQYAAPQKKFAQAKTGHTPPQQYKYEKNKVRPLQRVESSLFKEGYVRGTFNGYIGVPGAGKSRLAIQEVFNAASKGLDCLYLYNESSRHHFDNYIAKITNELGINPENPRITWCDMSDEIQKVASYEGIEAFYDNFWAQQTRYWLQSNKNPGFVVTDSFSNIGRRYIPQLWEAHQSYIQQLTDLVEPLEKKPVFIEVHQKSGSAYERDNDSVTGGFGLTHQLDANIVFTIKKIGNKWDSERYNTPEGRKVYTVYVPKDRFALSNFEETQVVIQNGKMMLKDTIADIVTKSTEREFFGNVNFEE